MTLNFLNGISKVVLSFSVLIASGALFMFSRSNANALQTSAVNFESTPGVNSYCYGTTNTYTVPTGSDLMITDISAPDYCSIKADTVTIWTHYGNYAKTSKHYSLSTGFVAPSGSVVSCPSCPGYIAGYLVKSSHTTSEFVC